MALLGFFSHEGTKDTKVFGGRGSGCSTTEHTERQGAGFI